MTEHYYTEQPETMSDTKAWETVLREQPFYFYTDRGVFSKDRVDFGSELLINTFRFPEVSGPIVDVGCGYGPIGLVLAKERPEKKVHMVDVNERALLLAEKNAQRNDIFNAIIYKSDCLHDVERVGFSAVVSNPPIRAGKKVVYMIYEQAAQYIVDGGELWIVIQKKQGAPSTITKLKTLFGEVEVVVRKKGYHIIRAVKI